MKLDVHERDIETKLCQTCAACCRVTFKLRDTNTRYRCFLRQIGYQVLPGPATDQVDCCDKKHDVTVDMGYCKHLDIEHQPEGVIHCCRIYGTSDFPELCAQFNCVSWAKANDNYNDSNFIAGERQQALDMLRARHA